MLSGGGAGAEEEGWGPSSTASRTPERASERCLAPPNITKGLSEHLTVTHPLCSWRVLASPTLPGQRPAPAALRLRRRDPAGRCSAASPSTYLPLTGLKHSPKDKRSRLNQDETGSTNNQKNHLPASNWRAVDLPWGCCQKTITRLVYLIYCSLKGLLLGSSPISA